MNSKVLLKIITPKGFFWNQKVFIVTVKTTEGYIGLQRNRVPFVAALDVAELHINSKKSKEYKLCAIAGGIVVTEKNYIKIITDAIEIKENIDLLRAQKAKKIAEAKIKANLSRIENIKAQLALKKAINRIEVRTS